MSIIHPGLLLAMERFPENRNVLRRLYSADDSFQSLCENYEQCSGAVGYWAESQDEIAPKRLREYLALLHELEGEILQYCSDDLEAESRTRKNCNSASDG